MTLPEEELEYSAIDGVRAKLRLFRAGQADAPVVVCLPAMGVRGSFYGEFARSLSKAGVHAVTSDLRGLGTSSVRPSRACDFGYHDILTRDVPALLDKVRGCLPQSPRFLLGHSLGGQLAVLYLAANPHAASGAILIAACNVYYKGWPAPRRFGVLGLALLLRLMGNLLGYAPAGRLGFAGNEARSTIVDWSNNCRTGTYVLKDSAQDYERLMSRLETPVLSVSFAQDRLAPHPAVENLLCKLHHCDVTRAHFRPGHPGLEAVDHFGWAKRSSPIVDTILRWTNARAVMR
jgi:predicted alpha/beta hydrolase